MFSLGGVLIKLSSWEALPFNGARSIVAAAVLSLYIGYSGRPQFTFDRYQLGGAIAFAFTNLTFMIATQSTTAANAVFLQFSAPIWVVLLGFLILKERPKPVDWVAMLLIFLGMSLFFGESLSPTGMIGNLVAILSGVGLGFMVVLLRGQKDGSPVETVILGSLIAFVIGLPFLFSQTWDGTNILLFMGLGIVQLGIPFILYSYAIKHLTAIETMLIMTLEPILNPVWVGLIVGEIPSLLPLIGGGIVIAAVTLRGFFVARA